MHEWVGYGLVTVFRKHQIYTDEYDVLSTFRWISLDVSYFAESNKETYWLFMIGIRLQICFTYIILHKTSLEK